MAAQANGAVGEDTETQGGFFRRFIVGSEELRREIERLRGELEEVNAAATAQETELRSEVDQLNRALDQERSKGILRRLFGLRALSPSEYEETEKTRERMRGRLAIALILALITLMALTFVYLLMLSQRFGALSTDDLIALIPMVGTTLLSPLVGLIGAVMGFYFGGETVVSAVNQTAEASRSATREASQAAAAVRSTAVMAAREMADETRASRSDRAVGGSRWLLPYRRS